MKRGGPKPKIDPALTCPICGFGPFFEPPWMGDEPSGQACPGCGIEFGLQDGNDGGAIQRVKRQTVYRNAWIERGRPWTSTTKKPPTGWPTL